MNALFLLPKRGDTICSEKHINYLRYYYKYIASINPFERWTAEAFEAFLHELNEDEEEHRWSGRF